MTDVRGSVVITGASSGFGQAAARGFAKEGFPLVLMARRDERLADLADELSMITPCHTVKLDVRDQKAVFSAFESLPDGFDSPAILVNNAGLALGLSGAHETDLDDLSLIHI